MKHSRTQTDMNSLYVGNDSNMSTKLTRTLSSRSSRSANTFNEIQDTKSEIIPVYIL